MQTMLIGASDVHYKKDGKQKQFYVLRCLAPVKSYKNSETEKLGYEQKELFVTQRIYEQAKALKSFPIEVELKCETDPFKRRVDITSIDVLNQVAA